MRAILMAAGVGSRMGNAFDCPKCTLDVGGIPLVRKTVSMLRSKGIDVSIVTGYRHSEVEAVLEGMEVDVHYNPFFKVTNSMASLWFARDVLIEEDTILANADVFWDEDILDDLLSDGHDVVMLGDESRRSNGDYFFDVKDGMVVRYGKELALEERTTEYVGIAKLSGSFVPTFRDNLLRMVEGGRYDMWWENVLYENIDTAPIHVRDVGDMFWAEVDYPADYDRILEYIRTGNRSCKHGSL